MLKLGCQLLKLSSLVSATFLLAAGASGQPIQCVQGAGYDICPTIPQGCKDDACKRGHLGVPPILPPDGYLTPVTHPPLKIDRSASVPWETDSAELAKLRSSGIYRIVHYDLNPGHAGGSGFTIGPAGYFKPTRFSEPPISLADNESVFKIAVYIPDNHWGGSNGLYSGANPGKTQQIYIPQLVEWNGVDQAGNIIHFTQFRGFNGTGKGHNIAVDIFIQKAPPAFAKRIVGRARRADHLSQRG